MPKSKVKFIEKRGYVKMMSCKSKFKKYCPEKLISEPRKFFAKEA